MALLITEYLLVYIHTYYYMLILWLKWRLFWGAMSLAVSYIHKAEDASADTFSCATESMWSGSPCSTRVAKLQFFWLLDFGSHLEISGPQDRDQLLACSLTPSHPHNLPVFPPSSREPTTGSAPFLCFPRVCISPRALCAHASLSLRLGMYVLRMQLLAATFLNPVRLHFL